MWSSTEKKLISLGLSSEVRIISSWVQKELGGRGANNKIPVGTQDKAWDVIVRKKVKE